MSNRLPIPRLADPQAGRKFGRTARACDQCRIRKWKCDGSRPKCGQCADIKELLCIYSEPKRDRDKKELERVKQKANLYEGLLREVIHEVELPLAKKIGQALVCFRVQLQFIHTDLQYSDIRLKGLRHRKV